MTDPLSAPPGAASGTQTPADTWPMTGADRPMDEQAYRPLSLGAVAGFSISALYGVVLILCAIAAVLKGAPLLWPLASLLFPLGGAVVSGVAWLFIQRSEGTRAGATLALWGVMLGLGFGLTYTAYYLAKYLVIREQSTSFSRKWINKLAEGEIDGAYLDTIRPDMRPRETDPARLRETFLRLHNQMADGRGMYDRFSQMQLVQLLHQANGKIEIQSKGLGSWQYVNGGYEVGLQYRIKTPEASWDTQLVVFGSEARGSDARQWMVVITQTGMKEDSLEYTPLGRTMFEVRRASIQFLQMEWQRRIENRQWFDAFLSTLPSDQRKELRTRFALPTVVAGFANLQSPLGRAVLSDPGIWVPGFREFVAGGFIKRDEQFASVDNKLLDRDTLPSTVMDVMQQPRMGQSIALDGTPYPWVREDGRLRIPHGIKITLPSGLIMFGQLILETDADPVFAAAEDEFKVEAMLRGLPWRIRELRLLSLRLPSTDSLPRPPPRKQADFPG